MDMQNQEKINSIMRICNTLLDDEEIEPTIKLILRSILEVCNG